MRAVSMSALLLLVGCMDALPHEDPTVTTAARAACAGLEGMTFSSVEQGECGLTPTGVAQCHWQLTFAAYDATRTAYQWGHSDVSESGFVSCDDHSILSDEATLYEGSFDEESLDLIWDDLAYTLAQ